MAHRQAHGDCLELHASLPINENLPAEHVTDCYWECVAAAATHLLFAGDVFVLLPLAGFWQRLRGAAAGHQQEGGSRDHPVWLLRPGAVGKTVGGECACVRQCTVCSVFVSFLGA